MGINIEDIRQNIKQNMIIFSKVIVNRGESNVVDLMKSLNELCLQFPSVALELIFDETIEEEIRDHILFVGLKDDFTMCTSSLNPKWVSLVRKHIIPVLDKFPEGIQSTMRWYQRIHNV